MGSRPVFGQGYPPLEPQYPRDRPCPMGNHLLSHDTCTECGYWVGDLCPIPKCQNVTHAELCDEHEGMSVPEARA